MWEIVSLNEVLLALNTVIRSHQLALTGAGIQPQTRAHGLQDNHVRDSSANVSSS